MYEQQRILPIGRKQDIEAIRRFLKGRIRDLLLFDMVTQTGINATLLLRLKAKDLQHISVGDPLPVGSFPGETASGVYVTKLLHNTLIEYFKQLSPQPDDYLFKSRKGDRPLTLSSVSTMVKSWFRDTGLTGLSGTKSLQKTWEWHYKIDANPDRTAQQGLNGGIRPIAVETVKDKVYSEISRAIISGRMAPGERLLEEKIAEQMQVSRMPVREALHRLQEAGFISSFGKSGKVVNQLSRKSLDEITTIRMMLETKAARQAIANLNESTLSRLEKLHIRLIHAIDRNEIDEMLRLNKKFHFTLYEDAHMPILQQIILGLWDRVSPYIHILLREGDALASSQDVKRDHQGMLEGMRKRDADMVCKWLEADLIEGRQMVYRLMDKWGVQ